MALNLFSTSTMSSGFLASTSTISTLLWLFGHMMFPPSRKCHKESLSTHRSRLSWSREDPNLKKKTHLMSVVLLKTKTQIRLKNFTATMRLVNSGIAHLTSLDGRAKEAEEYEKEKLLERTNQKQETPSTRIVWQRPTSPIYSSGHLRQLSQKYQTEEPISARNHMI